MDASPSASGNGFDAALKALEELDTTAAPSREDKPIAGAASIIEPVSAIGFSDVEEADEPAAIGAVPAAELIEFAPEPPMSAEVLEHLLQSAGFPSVAAEPAPAPPPAPAPVVAAPVAGRFGKVAVGLALFSSVLSAVGLVVAERTIMSAQLVVADARERQQQLEHANKLISDLGLVRDKQIELLRAQQAQLAATPVTSAELQHKMDNLQTGLLARDPLNDVVSAIRAGQTDTNARFNEFGMKIARLEAAVGGEH